MLSFAYSIARCWVIVSRPPLVIIGTAAGTPRIGLRARAAVIVTMLPPLFCATICLMASWVTYRKPSRFVETSALKSSAVYSANGLVKKMPALLTRASIDWKRDSAVSTILAAVAGSPMWPSTRTTRSEAATSVDWVIFRELATTLKPRSTNPFTIAAPIPCEAPVTMAVFRGPLMVVSLLARGSAASHRLANGAHGAVYDTCEKSGLVLRHVAPQSHLPWYIPLSATPGHPSPPRVGLRITYRRGTR